MGKPKQRDSQLVRARPERLGTNAVQGCTAIIEGVSF